MTAGARRKDGFRPYAQGDKPGSDRAVIEKKTPPHRMTEFRRAEKQRRFRRKLVKCLTAAGIAMIVVTKAYSFVSEGAPGPECTRVPPFTGILADTEAPGTSPVMEKDCEKPAAAAGERPKAEEEGQESKALSDIHGMVSEEELVYLGEFEVTGYCGCDICCGKKEVKLTKMETVPKPGYTVAADPEVIPLGSYIVVDGVTYRVEDIGHAVKGKSLDIFFADHQEAIEFGRQERSVYLKQSL